MRLVFYPLGAVLAFTVSSEALSNNDVLYFWAVGSLYVSFFCSGISERVSQSLSHACVKLLTKEGGIK